MIESVQNGFLVRPFWPAHNCAPWSVEADRQEMYVYRTVEELQKDLPELLNSQQNEIIVPKTV